VSHTLTKQLWRLPPVLALHIKRFKHVIHPVTGEHRLVWLT
jgi:hypothetical protein